MTQKTTGVMIDAREALKADAVHVPNGMIVVYPWDKREKAVNISELVSCFNHCFSATNSTVCFVIDGEVYVCPYSKSVFYLLGLARLREAVFDVPFCFGEYPKYEKDRWDELCKKATETEDEQFEKVCIKYSDQKGLFAFEDEKNVLRNCFKLPDTGVLVYHRMYKVTYYPYIIPSKFDRLAMGYIGQFWENCGKVVFVYRNGRTYVAKGTRVADMLEDARFKAREIFVPFSNGEKIIDNKQKELWMSLKSF